MTRKRRKKISKKVTSRARSLALCILTILILIIPSVLLYRCVSNWSAESDGPKVSPADSIYHARMDSLIMQQTRIDTLNSSLFIYDLTEDCPVYGYRDSLELPPASCMKLITTMVSQHFLGMDYRFADSLFVGGPVEDGTLKGDLIVKANYDPLIESLDSLILGIQERGISKIEGNVVFCLPIRQAIDYHSSWTPGDIRSSQIPIMLKDEKRIRKDFMFLMHKAKINQTGTDILGDVPEGAECFFSQGHTVREILNPTLMFSNNVMAELLFNRSLEQTGMNMDEIYDYLSENLKIMLDLNMEDGSGLSPDNSVSTQVLVAVLRYLWQSDQEWMLANLPWAGSQEQRGTLMRRMTENECAEHIWAKTGTLTSTGTSSLAGYCKGLFDHWYAFAIINHNTPVAEGRIFQDSVCLEMVREDNGQQSTDNSHLADME